MRDAHTVPVTGPLQAILTAKVRIAALELAYRQGVLERLVSVVVNVPEAVVAEAQHLALVAEQELIIARARLELGRES